MPKPPASRQARAHAPRSPSLGVRRRQLLARLDLLWQSTRDASLRLIDELDRESGSASANRGRSAAERYVPLLCTFPAITSVLAYTIAAELGDFNRFPTPRKLPVTAASARASTKQASERGERDLRGPLSKQVRAP